MTKRSVFNVAFSWRVVRRSLIMSAIVGTILIAINHANCIAAGKFGSACALKSILTLIVPYCVATVSCVLTHADQNNADRQE